MSNPDFSAADEAALQSDWLKRETKLFAEIDNSVTYYAGRAKVALRSHRLISIAVVVVGPMAPVAVAASTAKDAILFSMPSGFYSGLAIVLTVLLAILDGVRRIFRFDRRWTSCNLAKVDLRRARETYLRKRIGLTVGDAAWQSNLGELREAYEAATGKELQGFVADIVAASRPQGRTQAGCE